LFATAALALVAPPQVGVPTVLLVGDTLIGPLLWEHRRHLERAHLRTVPPFTPASLPLLVVGLVLGALLLGHVSPAIGRLALAGVVLLFVWRQLTPGHPATVPAHTRRWWDRPPSAAFAGGVLDGWLGTGGVAIAMFLAARRLRPGLFVVSILMYFIASDAIRIVTYAVLGYWTAASVALYVRVAPVALAGYVVGILLRRRLPSERVFHGVVLTLLIAYAVALIARVALAR
jgi:uncharacterized membrane protein YfcA